MAWLALLPIAVATGALVAFQPIAAVLVAGAAISLVFLGLGDRLSRLFLTALTGLLIGYAFAGRGFAYLGVPPLFVGEMVLLLAGFSLITSQRLRRVGVPQLVLLVFMAWGAVRTVPYVSEHGLDAPRDAALWGYAFFALSLSLLLRPRHIRGMVRIYARLAPLFILWMPILVIAWFTFQHLLPTVPGGGVKIPHFKAGDVAVHLAGIAAFVLVGLYPRTGWRGLTVPALWLGWLGSVAIAASISRGAMLAAATVTVLMPFRRALGRWVTPMVIGLLTLGFLAGTNLEIETGGHRTVSAEQLIENVRSIFGDTSTEDRSLTGTRQWREAWWDTIVGYTIQGEYFWEGKGYGIHLAEDDGFTVEDGSNRAPHNAHLNILARSGVPGLALWIAVQVTFAITMAHAASIARGLGRTRWVAIIGWIFVYWLAALVNMTFDVYLEGPQGGIVFWSVVGIGFAVAACVREAARARDENAGRAPRQERRPALESHA